MPAGGIQTCMLDGANYNAATYIEYSVSRTSRETLVHTNGSYDYTSKNEVGKISVTFRDDGSTDMSEYDNMTNTNGIFALSNGKTVTISNGHTLGVITVNTERGEYTVEMAGDVQES